MLMFPSSEFKKLMIGDKRFNTYKINFFGGIQGSSNDKISDF
jgi:hypothetical protein